MTLVVDTSAMMAILLGEPEATAFAPILRASTTTVISAGSVIELYRVMQARAGSQRWDDVDHLLDLYGIVAVPVDRPQLLLAKDGMRPFGLGRGAPPAMLNFGDLFAYALARSLPAPLLFKGNDFGRTDIIPAWTP